jgi:hypothetical protein
MYATTRYRFVRLKVTHKISPLEELIGESKQIFALGTEQLRNDLQISHFYMFLSHIKVHFILKDNVNIILYL